MIIERALRRAGIMAMGDPPPGAGTPSGMSSPGYRRGSIQLVGSMGVARTSTYLGIYRMNPWVYAATNYIARGIGRLPLHVYALDADGDKTRIRADLPKTGRPVPGAQLDRILSNPVGASKAAFYGTTVRERKIYGNALWEVISDGRLPVGVKRIPWHWVQHIEADGEGGVAYYELALPGSFGSGPRRRVLAGRDTIHFGLGSDPNEVWGVSILESCHHTLALHEAIMRHLNAYFENSARGSGYVKVDTEKQAAEARKVITQLFTSPENAGKPIIMSGEWKSFSDSPDHSSIVELVKESRIEIAAAFQVPPPILGLLENAIRANVKELREQFGRDTIGPDASEFEDDVEAQLLTRSPSWANLFVEFQLAEMLRPDLEARALVYQRLMFVLAIDEIRAIENLPPLKIKGVTDVPWVASGAMPLTTAAKGKQTQRIPAAEDAPSAEALELVRLMDALENGHRTEAVR